MNQDGWSLNELLIGLGVLAFLLVLSTILIQSKFKKVNQVLGEKVETEVSSKPVIVYTYDEMEQGLVLAATEYISELKDASIMNDKTKLTMEELYQKGFFTKIYDPDDTSTTCNGYVTLEKKGNSFSYTPYIKCGKNYETKK